MEFTAQISIEERQYSLKILLVHRYFWPDTPPYASMLRSIARGLVEAGHEVTVISSQPGYKPSAGIPRQPSSETMDGFDVIRSRLLPERGRNPILRSLNMLVFLVGLAFHIIFRKRYQSVMISTMPPVVSGFVASIAARLTGARFVYHCQDLYPEAGDISGILNNRLLYRFLMWMDKGTCERASLMVVLSEDMRQTLQARPLGPNARVEIINNFELPSFNINPQLRNGFAKKQGQFRVLFAGNLGRFQGLENVMQAAHLLADHPDIEFVFMGDGVAKASLEENAANLLGQTVHFLGHQASDVAKQAMAEADLGLVTLNPGIYKVAYPSKTMTYLSQGTPLMLVAEAESALYQFVQNERIGFSCQPNQPRDLADSIIAASRLPGELQAMRTKARQIADVHFSERAAVGKWQAVYQDLSEKQFR